MSLACALLSHWRSGLVSPFGILSEQTPKRKQNKTKHQKQKPEGHQERNPTKHRLSLVARILWPLIPLMESLFIWVKVKPLDIEQMHTELSQLILGWHFLNQTLSKQSYSKAEPWSNETQDMECR